MKFDESTNVVNCTFAYECPQNWEGMDSTENDDVRFCSKCNQNVYFAKNNEILQRLTSEKKCVAVLREDKIGLNHDNYSQRPDFSHVTAGIPVMPERFSDDKVAFAPEPIKPKKSDKTSILIVGAFGLLIGIGIGIMIGIMIGLFIAKTISNG